MAEWYHKGLGFRLSSANTFFMVNDDRIREELLLKKIKCEIPDCTVQAVGYLKCGVPAYCCISHISTYERQDAKSKELVRMLKADIMDVLELHKQMYTDARQGQALGQLAVVKEPGKPFMESLNDKEAGVAIINKSNLLPLPIVRPF